MHDDRPYVRSASYSASRMFKYEYSRSDSPMKTAAPTSCCQNTSAMPATSMARMMACGRSRARVFDLPPNETKTSARASSPVLFGQHHVGRADRSHAMLVSAAPVSFLSHDASAPTSASRSVMLAGRHSRIAMNHHGRRALDETDVEQRSLFHVRL